MHKVINFLILTTNSKLFAVKSLSDTITSLGHHVSTCDPYKINQAQLNEAHIIINRNTGLNYQDDDLIQLEKIIGNQAQVISNSLHCSKILRDKYQQWLYLKSLLPHEDLIDTFKLNEYEKARQSYPEQKKWIFKTLRGQQARGVKTSSNLEEDAKVILDSGDDAYIIQPYFPLKREIRLLIIKSSNSKEADQLILEKRPKEQSDEFHILNFKSSQTKLLRISDAPKKAMEIGHKIIESDLNFNFISVDFLEDIDNNIKLLEINSCPGLEGAQKELRNANSQIDLCEKYINQLISDYHL